MRRLPSRMSTSMSGERSRVRTATCTGASPTTRPGSPSISHPQGRYRGRFFQHVTPVPDSEHLAQGLRGEEDKIGFTIASGGYFLETNGGGASGNRAFRSIPPSPPLAPTRRAPGSRERSPRSCTANIGATGTPMEGAGEGIGPSAPPRTPRCLGRFRPYVIGPPIAMPDMFTVRMHAQRILAHEFDQIVDAVEPGGGGDPFEGLGAEERDSLTEVARMGFPLGS